MREPFHHAPAHKAGLDGRLKNLHHDRNERTLPGMHFSAGTAAARDGHPVAAVAGPNARWYCGIVLFDPRHGVPVLAQNGR